MKKIILFIVLFFSTFIFAKLKITGKYFQNFILNSINDKIYYSDFNIIYLKLNKKSYNYKIYSTISFYYYLYPSNNQGVSEKGYNIDRLFISFWRENLKIKIGRFLPLWGKAYFFKPTDIFRNKKMLKTDIEESGITGAEIKIFPYNFLSFNFIFIPDILIDNSIGIAKLNTKFFSFDFSSFYYYNGININKKIGFNFKGDLELDIYGEFLYTINNKNYELSYGIDYSFFNKLMFIIEYYYNSNSENKINYINYIPFSFSEYLYLNIFYFNSFRTGINNFFNLYDYSCLISLYFSKEIFNSLKFFISIYLPTEKNPDKEFNINILGKFILNSYINVKF